MILLTTEDAAAYLGLRPGTLMDWRWQRTGPPWIRISRGCVRYDQTALDSWLALRVVHEIPD